MLVPTLVTRLPLLPLCGVFSFVLPHTRFNTFEISVSLETGSFGAELSLCLSHFPIVNLDLVNYTGYFHISLVHFLKIGISLPCYYLLHLPS